MDCVSVRHLYLIRKHTSYSAIPTSSSHEAVRPGYRLQYPPSKEEYDVFNLKILHPGRQNILPGHATQAQLAENQRMDATFVRGDLVWLFRIRTNPSSPRKSLEL